MRAERPAWADRHNAADASRRPADQSVSGVRPPRHSERITCRSHSHHAPEEASRRVQLGMDCINRASPWLDPWVAPRTLPWLLGGRRRSR